MIICFHNPNEPNGYLSNWYMSKFVVDGVQFTSMEQYMMYCKADLFADDKMKEAILSTSDVAKIKHFGRQVRNFNDVVWDKRKEAIITRGLMCKFQQNPQLRNMLLSTGDAVLAECAVHDRIWGIGLSMTDPNRLDMTKWRGQNLLGKCLMVVRAKLR